MLENYPEVYGLTNKKFFEFIYHLLAARRGYARLLCVLADIDRRQYERDPFEPWTSDGDAVARVQNAPGACLVELPPVHDKTE